VLAVGLNVTPAIRKGLQYRCQNYAYNKSSIVILDRLFKKIHSVICQEASESFQKNMESTQLNSTQLYYDTFAAEQLNSWIAKYSSIT